MECDFANNKFVETFREFSAIQKSYYPTTPDNAYKYTYTAYQSSPVFAFDCTRTDEPILGGTVDIRLEIDAQANIAAHTAANCLIIYDNYFEYSPFKSIVTKRA